MASCTWGPREPAKVGVIESSEYRDGITTLAFEDGSALEVAFDESEGLDGGTGIDPGTLWLSDAAGSWYMTLRETSIAPLGSIEERDCYWLGSFGTRDDRHIRFDNALRLPIAPGFDPGSVRDGRFDQPNVGFCVDEEGVVLFYEG